ncbi:MAG: hypothetical protein JOZ78_16920 [Chroococcidiopsidaceae cyanobacterium CP_BM_ER_R8_30]|nr:hypothetical protein [Chroococcidiopsidaceae cyanobacterium CP_BM_ER_R8_30]
MSIVICPGIHNPEFTQGFLSGLESEGYRARNLHIFPAQNYSAVSAFHILQFLSEDRQVPHHTPLVFISFSAGVVGAIGAAWGWQLLGGQVKAFIALDGWGVPLTGDFPIHRLSHDKFTYWSSALLGSGEESFYAKPPVSHLDLWRSPEIVQGVCISSPTVRMSAANFLVRLLTRYYPPLSST